MTKKSLPMFSTDAVFSSEHFQSAVGWIRRCGGLTVYPFWHYVPEDFNLCCRFMAPNFFHQQLHRTLNSDTSLNLCEGNLMWRELNVFKKIIVVLMCSLSWTQLCSKGYLILLPSRACCLMSPGPVVTSAQVLGYHSVLPVWWNQTLSWNCLLTCLPSRLDCHQLQIPGPPKSWCQGTLAVLLRKCLLNE